MARKIQDLNHTYVLLNYYDGEVFVLDTGALINAESEAMFQALHSRSVGGFKKHLAIMAKKGPANFMQEFYVGYGHHSIGDCGDTTIFVEGVSMLAVKAVQDNMLFRGQESSTRYIDFSKQKFIDPSRSQKGQDLLEMQRELYIVAQKPTREALRKKHPRRKEEEQETYEKAIRARAFDITRSLLPAGASTNFAWHTDLRQAADKLLFLRHHPLPEVRDIAYGILGALKKHHPNSFGHELNPATEAYQELIAQDYYFHNSDSPITPVVDTSKIDLELLTKHERLFKKRPEKTGLPKYLGTLGTVRVDYQIDFGSFRDIQRHRAVTQRMPLLTTELGFNKWYTDNLPFNIKRKIPSHLRKIEKGILELDLPKEMRQYFIPMGYNTSNMFTGDLPAFAYFIEIRDSRFVHPTLQKVAHSIGEQIKSDLRIRLNVDTESNRFDIKRGEQDIVERK